MQVDEFILTACATWTYVWLINDWYAEINWPSPLRFLRISHGEVPVKISDLNANAVVEYKFETKSLTESWIFKTSEIS